MPRDFHDIMPMLNKSGCLCCWCWKTPPHSFPFITALYSPTLTLDLLQLSRSGNTGAYQMLIIRREFPFWHFKRLVTGGLQDRCACTGTSGWFLATNSRGMPGDTFHGCRACLMSRPTLSPLPPSLLSHYTIYPVTYSCHGSPPPAARRPPHAFRRRCTQQEKSG